MSYPCLATCYHRHSSCYPFINYQLFLIFFLCVSHILLVICHELLVIHSSTMSYPFIAPSYRFISQLPVIFYIYFYNCLFRTLNDFHKINLDNTLVSSSSIDGKTQVVFHPKSQIKMPINVTRTRTQFVVGSP